MLTGARTKSWIVRFAVTLMLGHAVTLAVPSQLGSDPSGSALASRAGTTPPNEECYTDADCASNLCHACNTPSADRLDPSGAGEPCYYAPYYQYGDFYCQGFGLNHTCANQGECRNGSCQGGVCVATMVGQACKDDLGCSGAQVCNNGACFVPATKSLWPGASCKVDASCKSGQCATNILNSLANGANNTVETRPQCIYFKNGQSGCRSLEDCAAGLCQNGVCKLGKDGDRCIANYQCTGLCNDNGVCFTPTKPLLAGQTCNTNSNCLSNSCVYDYPAFYKSVTRPDFRNPDQNFTYLYEAVCLPSKFGQKCNTSADCAQGLCTSGVCKGQPLNSACTQDKACLSLTCSSSFFGVCSVSQAYIQCSQNSDCYSKSCTTQYPCYNGPTLGCAPLHCAAVPSGGRCRRDADCNPGYACVFGACRAKFSPGK